MKEVEEVLEMMESLVQIASRVVRLHDARDEISLGKDFG